jgi:ABC-type uncharacterized transport system involved in gliding motility auxiliary subunit
MKGFILILVLALISSAYGQYPSWKNVQRDAVTGKLDSPITTNNISLNLTTDTSISLAVTVAMHYITTSNASPITATLPALVTTIAANPTKVFSVKNLGAGQVTYVPSGADTIFYIAAGQTSIQLNSGEACDFVATPTQWIVR